MTMGRFTEFPVTMEDGHRARPAGRGRPASIAQGQAPTLRKEREGWGTHRLFYPLIFHPPIFDSPKDGRDARPPSSGVSSLLALCVPLPTYKIFPGATYARDADWYRRLCVKTFVTKLRSFVF